MAENVQFSELNLKKIASLLDVEFEKIEQWLIFQGIKIRLKRVKTISNEDYNRILKLLEKGIKYGFQIRQKDINKTKISELCLTRIQIKNEIDTIDNNIKRLEKTLLNIQSINSKIIKFNKEIVEIEHKYRREKKIQFIKLDSTLLSLKKQKNKQIENLEFLKNLNSDVEIQKYINKKNISAGKLIQIQDEINDINEKLTTQTDVLFKVDLIKLAQQKEILNQFIVKPKKKQKFKSLIKNSKTKKTNDNNQKGYYAGKDYFDSTKNSLKAILIPMGKKPK